MAFLPGKGFVVVYLPLSDPLQAPAASAPRQQAPTAKKSRSSSDRQLAYVAEETRLLGEITRLVGAPSSTDTESDEGAGAGGERSTPRVMTKDGMVACTPRVATLLLALRLALPAFSSAGVALTALPPRGGAGKAAARHRQFTDAVEAARTAMGMPVSTPRHDVLRALIERLAAAQA